MSGRKTSEQKDKRVYNTHSLYIRSIFYILLIAGLWILHEFVIFIHLTTQYNGMILSYFLANSIMVLIAAIGIIWALDIAYNVDWDV